MEQLPGVSIEVSIPNPNSELPVVQIPEKFRCTNCQKDLLESEIKKRPLDFTKKADGSLEPNMKRYSAFCNVCEGFIKIVDEAARRELYNMFHKR